MNHKGTQRIEAERLVLRRITLADAKGMYRNWASDPEVTKFLMWPPHESVEVTKEVIAFWAVQYAKPDFYQWVIEWKESSDVIGTITVMNVDESIMAMEIGYCIGRAFWGKGIVKEALQAVTQFLFEEVGVNRITAKHDVENPNSGKVMEKCGMRYEGTLRQACRSNRGLFDYALYAILRSDWEEMK